MIYATKKKKQEIENSLVEVARRRGQTRQVISRLIRNKLGMIGLVIVFILLVLIIFAGVFTKHGINAQDFSVKLTFPSAEYIFGTDHLGRDIWTRLLYGGRISLMVSVIAVTISLGIGMILGSIAGYFGSKYDTIIMRAMDILMAVPALLLAIVISAALGTGPINTALAISISGIPPCTRIMRSTVMSIRDNEFVEAAKATGSNHLRIIFRHILPNTLAPLIVVSSLSIGGNIMAISALSFIGLGVQPPTPEWGSILADGRSYIRQFYPIILFPSLFIALAMFGFNLLGDALRDALDPKLKN
jgi:peptide/nickel transport system permease protein